MRTMITILTVRKGIVTRDYLLRTRYVMHNRHDNRWSVGAFKTRQVYHVQQSHFGSGKS